MAFLENSTDSDTIQGTAGTDFINADFYALFYQLGDVDDDTVSGGAGSDYIYQTGGTDALFGGTGYDSLYLLFEVIVTRETSLAYEPNLHPTADYAIASSVVDLASGTYQVTYERDTVGSFLPATLVFGGTLAEFEALIGSNGDDVLRGSGGGVPTDFGPREEFRPDAGNDSIDGRGGFDVLAYEVYGVGSPSRTQGIVVEFAAGRVFDGLGGVDLFTGIEMVIGSGFADVFKGGAGNDWMEGSPTGADAFYGGGGIDTVSFSIGGGNVTGMVANLAAGKGTNGYGDALVFAGIEVLRGSSLGDSFTGSVRAEELFGISGNDTLSGGGGNDTLWGGSGDDILLGGIGLDTLFGGSGADRVDAGAGADSVEGGSGNDTLDGGDADDSLLGDEGQDLLQGGNGNDVLFGGEEGDTLRGSTGRDRLEGGEGNDSLFGEDRTDFLLGDDGDDLLRGGGNDPATSDRTTNEYLSGDGGNDTLLGEAGGDYLIGGEGGDTLYGGAEDDFLVGDSGQRYTGTDEFTLAVVARGNDLFDGGKGTDTVSYAFSEAAVVASLLAGRATGEGIDRLVDVENLVGSRFADTLVGSIGDNYLIGGRGDDVIRGLAGDDIIAGSAGADSVDGGEGFDRVIFDDTVALIFQLELRSHQLIYRLISESGEAKGDVYVGIEEVFGSSDADRLAVRGEVGAQLSGGAGHDRLAGDRGADSLSGGVGDDVIEGGAGNDQIDGGAGADRLSGMGGDDRLTAGSGMDRLIGGEGRDLLFGGTDAARDTFVYTAVSQSRPGTARDVVYNFTAGSDDIDLRGIDARPLSGTDDAFVWGGKAAAAHSVWWLATAQGVLVRADVTGDARADLEILLQGADRLGAGDLLL